MQVSKSLLHSGIHRTDEKFADAGIPASIRSTSLALLFTLRVPLMPTIQDAVAASQGVC
jgi:hypothetical protein